MPASLPTESEFDPYLCDLDAQHAWKNFGGLTVDQACAKFDEAPESYQEDFMFMGGKAFAFYYPVIDSFLRKSTELSKDDLDDRQSWILPQCIKSQFQGPRNEHVRHLKDSVLELCGFMIENVKLFADDWRDVTEIEREWQELKQQVTQSS